MGYEKNGQKRQNKMVKKPKWKKRKKKVRQNVKMAKDIARAGSPFCAHRQRLCLSDNHATQNGLENHLPRMIDYTFLVPTPSCESPL